MRPSLCLTAVFVLAGCGASSEVGVFQDGPPPAGSGGRPTGGTGGAAGAGAGSGGSGVGGGEAGAGGGSGIPEPGPPTQLVPSPAGLVGVTSDGWAVYRDADTLRAVSIDEKASVEKISDDPGSVIIRGRVVFNWADVDWTVNIGNLSVWTAASGAHEIGMTTYAEALVSASEDGSTIVYPANMDEESMDLMIASSDLTDPRVLIETVGRGSDTTCGARYGFVGQRLFVGWCEPGDRSGRLERYDLVDGEWAINVIARDVLPEWTTDATGTGVFYQTSQYRAYYVEEGQDDIPIDTSVGRGFVVPDGSAVLYTVGDQLRRTTIPRVNPIPVVTRGYANPLAFSPMLDVALYATKVSYMGGTWYDLRLVSTIEFEPEPIELVGDAIAGLARSRMTEDGRFVFYLTTVTPAGGTLHVVDVDGNQVLALPNVVEVLAAKGSTIVFTHDSSDPMQYPVVADLSVIDVAEETEPRLIESKVADARTFQLDATRERVVFARSGVDRDPMALDRAGLFYATAR